MAYALNKNKYLLPPESTHLRQILSDYEDQDARNCILLSLALRTGGRAQEILNLRIQDFNAFDQTVYIRGIKNSNDREIPIEARFFEKMLRFLNSYERTSELVFPISYHRLYQIWEFYRPAPKTFHSLRHTFAIELYQKTKDIRLVQVALGHRNITNTMI
ncbi:MAG: tyrosine-type recombinase/integrase, partial [Bdellovibrio sp.]